MRHMHVISDATDADGTVTRTLTTPDRVYITVLGTDGTVLTDSYPAAPTPPVCPHVYHASTATPEPEPDYSTYTRVMLAPMRVPWAPEHLNGRPVLPEPVGYGERTVRPGSAIGARASRPTPRGQAKRPVQLTGNAPERLTPQPRYR